MRVRKELRKERDSPVGTFSRLKLEQACKLGKCDNYLRILKPQENHTVLPNIDRVLQKTSHVQVICQRKYNVNIIHSDIQKHINIHTLIIVLKPKVIHISSRHLLSENPGREPTCVRT